MIVLSFIGKTAKGDDIMKGNNMACRDGVCGKCHGMKLIVLGIVLLAWALWIPDVKWQVVIGGLIALGGLLKIVKPVCGHC